MTQERIEAAAEALAAKDRANLSSWHQEEATAALAAADAVMFSDEAIERAAQALYKPQPWYSEDGERVIGYRPWSWLESEYQEALRNDARAVVAALKGEQ